MRIKTPLWEHQKQMVAFAQESLDKRGFAWWLAGCAVGKTLAALKIMEERSFKRTVVLTTKAAVTSAWVADIHRHVHALPYLHRDEKPLKRLVERLAASPPEIFIINYESAWRILNVLREYAPQFIIADESHRLKGHSSKQSRLLAKLDAPYKLAMTGTGWDDRPTDIYGQARWLDPVMKRGRAQSRLFDTWTGFFERYVIYHQHENLKIPTGYKNQDELRERIAPFTMYVDSETVLDLPEELDIEIDIPQPAVIKRMSKELHDEMITEYEGDYITPDNRLVMGLRLHQLSGGYFGKDGVVTEVLEPKDNPKLQATLSILEELDDKPVVIFTRFTPDVELLAAEIRKTNRTVKLLVGGTHEHNEWQAGGGQVLIANIQAGSTGIKLDRARYAIYYSIGHSRTDYNQSRYRIRRPDSDKAYPITYYHLIMKGIDQQIRRAMLGKKRYSDYILSELEGVTP